MELSAKEINEKQFHDAWRGYNQAEVDDFLDRVAEAIDRLQRENGDLKQRIAELDQAVAASRDTEEMLKKTLVTAQRAAEEAIANAKSKAEEIITQAEERVHRTETEARERIVNAENESRRKAGEVERDLTARKRELDERIGKLHSFETDIKKRLKTFLEQQLRALDSLTEVESPRVAPPPARPAGAPAGTGAPADTRPQAQPSPRTAGPGPRGSEGAESPEEPAAQEGVQTPAFDKAPESEDVGEDSAHRGRGVRDLFFRNQS
jgi:cell division initiation protein